MKVIGVTGGVGSGKTAVLDAIAQKYSCKVLLADVIANNLKKKGQVCYEPLLSLLGTSILNECGDIDKMKMAQLIFADQVLLEKVNQMIHPEVKRYILSEIEAKENAKQYDFLFVEAALLIEAGYREFLDELWYIYASYEVRLDRLQKGRGYTEQKVQSIISKQLSESIYREACDEVIDNSGNLVGTMCQIDKILGQKRKKHEAL